MVSAVRDCTGEIKAIFQNSSLSMGRLASLEFVFNVVCQLGCAVENSVERVSCLKLAN